MSQHAPQPRSVTALVMAGKRSGALDPLAAAAGVAQKAVVPVNGVPMIERVVAAVAACPEVAAIRIVAHDKDEIAAIPAIAALVEEGRLAFAEGRFNIVDSVLSGAEGVEFPLLITTADNCLVTPEGYSEFIAKCRAEDAQGAAGLARREAVQEADPLGQTRFYEFSDGGYSNCNMYWIGSREALAAAEIMREGGQFVKYPSRIIKAFGLMNLVRFRLGWGSKEKLFAQISRRFGFKLVPIVLSDGHYAIDVDNERTLAVTEKILKRREGDRTGGDGSVGAA
ncbi:NTP transferase domain-containing protein [Erythrobacter sp. HL-111]|uniref:NTP transferase domain-containing protein n=1 Tax=Erythrobacter sp. HL-111 TaxID=1798193 RepID=UPI0006DBA7A3|nr:NTP transferase domain-containing protein [Erythrobacter sp. HL-111]KPP91140.1 MAG: 4-diphosphocytidyl-2-methyl-D-erithritol synthase [Erythrobacteraceae bacterium HL-111]SDS46200.1 MobA-like NTP transferase domain-containing protein [Erythrobacter sp. HL-111]